MPLLLLISTTGHAQSVLDNYRQSEAIALMFCMLDEGRVEFRWNSDNTFTAIVDNVFRDMPTLEIDKERMVALFTAKVGYWILDFKLKIIRIIQDESDEMDGFICE